MNEKTLNIIKPDATKRNITGAINSYFENAGLRIVAQKRIKLTKEQAESFYDIHKERPFFDNIYIGVCTTLAIIKRNLF